MASAQALSGETLAIARREGGYVIVCGTRSRRRRPRSADRQSRHGETGRQLDEAGGVGAVTKGTYPEIENANPWCSDESYLTARWKQFDWRNVRIHNRSPILARATSSCASRAGRRVSSLYSGCYPGVGRRRRRRYRLRDARPRLRGGDLLQRRRLAGSRPACMAHTSRRSRNSCSYQSARRGRVLGVHGCGTVHGLSRRWPSAGWRTCARDDRAVRAAMADVVTEAPAATRCRDRLQVSRCWLLNSAEVGLSRTTKHDWKPCQILGSRSHWQTTKATWAPIVCSS